ncbi:MAG: 3'-5' exonuclease [Muribaculaceae bacterium]|nr:3'-5' exonuclease [Muribaculaceae bacterium]
MNLISLDIEATDKGEMLELAIIGHKNRETVYHSYFKPEMSKSWPNSQAVHHITPEMVKAAPSLRQERKTIQNILHNADGIIGFAIDNDIKYLIENNINVDESLTVIDVKDWFWFYKGKGLDIKFDSVPRLAKCAELMGFEFSEETEAHSAANDTLMTIKLFDALVDIADTGLPLSETIKQFDGLFAEEKRLYAEEMAKGYLSLIKTSKGYLIKNNHSQPSSDAELSIAVESRFLAEHDIREKFSKRETAPDSAIYNLRKSDIEFFKNYKNIYDPEKEHFYRHYLKARKKSKRDLPFHL